MKPIVLGFSGRIGSGKSTLAGLVASSLQVPCVSFGDYVRALASTKGLNSSDRAVLQELGSKLVQTPEKFCQDVLSQVNYQSGQSLVVEGVRHREVVDVLRRQVAPARFVLVYVKVSERRIEGMLYDEGNADKIVDDLVQHDTERQVTTILESMADIIVDNSHVRSPEEVEKEVLYGLKAFVKDQSFSEQFVNGLTNWVSVTKPEGEIRFDKNGIAWLDSTGTKAVEVIQDVTELGRSIDEILAQHPHLSQTQVRAALRYYEKNRDEVNEEVERRYQYSEMMRQRLTSRFTREELVARLRDKKVDQPDE